MAHRSYPADFSAYRSTTTPGLHYMGQGQQNDASIQLHSAAYTREFAESQSPREGVVRQNKTETAAGQPRRRIAVACARCRKRKIKCSGDNGDGEGCTNCKVAGADAKQCQFTRVGSFDPEPSGGQVLPCGQVTQVPSGGMNFYGMQPQGPSHQMGMLPSGQPLQNTYTGMPMGTVANAHYMSFGQEAVSEQYGVVNAGFPSNQGVNESFGQYGIHDHTPAWQPAHRNSSVTEGSLIDRNGSSQLSTVLEGGYPKSTAELPSTTCEQSDSPTNMTSLYSSLSLQERHLPVPTRPDVTMMPPPTSFDIPIDNSTGRKMGNQNTVGLPNINKLASNAPIVRNDGAHKFWNEDSWNLTEGRQGSMSSLASSENSRLKSVSSTRSIVVTEAPPGSIGPLGYLPLRSSPSVSPTYSAALPYSPSTATYSRSSLSSNHGRLSSSASHYASANDSPRPSISLSANSLYSFSSDNDLRSEDGSHHISTLLSGHTYTPLPPQPHSRQHTSLEALRKENMERTRTHTDSIVAGGGHHPH